MAATILTNPPLETLRAQPPLDVYACLGSHPGGLTDDEAAERLAHFGANVIREVKGKPLHVRLIANFTHLMAILLWVGGVIALIAQLPQLAIAIWMVNVINGAFSFWQEYRAEKATEALRRLLPLQVRVLRAGQEQKVGAESLVPGDVILLEEGDRISADCRLVQASELQADQATLTGESLPVRKVSDAVIQGSLSPAEVPNLAFAGTNVASGTGRAVVYATGMETQFGKIARLTQALGEAPSPLQREMAIVTRQVTFIAVGIGVLFFIASVLLAGLGLAESFIFALGMIVAFVPEGLLPTVTLSLAMGVQRMANRHALIKKLSSVETLGCTTVICTDKTGTLTQNAMTVTDIWLSGKRLKVTGGGYAPQGQIVDGGGPPDDSLKADLGELLAAAGLCNNARLLPPNDGAGRWTVLGDPTEAALRVAAPKGGVDLEALQDERPRIRELPFDSRRKRMSTLHQFRGAAGRSQLVAYVKGAPNEILALSTHIQINGERKWLSDDLRAEIRAANDAYARVGLRVLAMATRPLIIGTVELASPQRQPVSSYTIENVETELTFLGLMAMMDPPRPEVSEAVQKCHRAGIRIIMITGDYGLTAESIARRIGIITSANARLITGVELDGMSEEDLQRDLKDEVIFARVAPEHKMRIVSTLQALGQVVAVTGDGVNDAPALKKADIGVAMGITGTDVAKEAADVILTDDNFASIVNAIEEGRGVYANIKKFSTYIFTSNAPEAVPFVLFAFSGGRIPLALNVMHVLSIDLGTDMFPALGLGVEPPEPGLMDQPPRKLNAHLITRGLLARAYLWLGIPQSIAAMAAFYFMYWTNGYTGQWIDLPSDGPLYAAATAMALAAVVMTQVGNVFAQRTEMASTLRLPLFRNRLIWIGIAVEIILILAIVYTPFGNQVIGTAPFPAANWLFLVAWIPSLVLVDEIRKARLRRRLARRARKEARR